MKKTVLTFGLLAGALLSAMMLVTIPFADRIGYEKGQLIGYTTIVLAFLFVFFGVRSYRENVQSGWLSFGRGFAVGALITIIASICYVATWQVIYYRVTPDFTEKYAAYVIEKERAAGASEQAIAEKTEKMEKMKKLYANPVINAAVTFLEPLPIGLLISLVSSAILRRKRQGG